MCSRRYALDFFQVRSALHIYQKILRYLCIPNSYYYLHFIWWPEAGGSFLLCSLFEKFRTQLPAPSYHAPPLPPHTRTRLFLWLTHCWGLLLRWSEEQEFFQGGDSPVLNMTQRALEITISVGWCLSCHSWSRWSFNHHQVSNSGCGSAVILSVYRLRRPTQDTREGAHDRGWR